MRFARPVVLLLLTGAVCWSLNSRLNIIPPLGKFLDPFAGFWQNGRAAADNLPTELHIEGLHEPVTVVWDDRHVPHIFAEHLHDLYMAQGYLMAMARLWQLDLSPRAAAGRLSEIFGPETISYDRLRRRIGMQWGAERSVEPLESDLVSGPALIAFAAGVNAYIAQLDYRSLPVEFKMADYEPEAYTTLSAALLLKSFQWTLSFRNDDAGLTRASRVFDPVTMQRLYPSLPLEPEPVIPAGTPWPFEPFMVPAPGSAGPPPPPNPTPAKDAGQAAPPEGGNPEPGSNNWALSGTRTASGKPILANDPHLGLTLPSVWYEMHLVAPDRSVYGVSAPGAPGIIFGFNNEVAWGITSGQSDAIDWYRLEFRDSTYSEYRYEHKWRPVSLRVEEIRVRDGETIFDTVRYTDFGPIPYLPDETPDDASVPVGCALRWAALEPSNELNPFLRLNSAHDVEGAVDALAGFGSPSLNFALADTAGNIAMVHAGRLPLRWFEQGRIVRHAADPANYWQGWIPSDQNPMSINPERGFVSSANQPVTDTLYPYWIGTDNYYPTERARRINELLREDSSATPEDMLRMQNDVLNLVARDVLPIMLELLEGAELSGAEQKAVTTLREWDYQHRADLVAPRIFSYWWWWMYNKIWPDDIEREDGNLAWPARGATKWMLLYDPESPFWDDQSTDSVVETREDVVQWAFKKSVSELTREFGPQGPGWVVGVSRGTNIAHLGQFPGFGRTGLHTGGWGATINATRVTFGPTWRMVISMDTPVRAWGILAGGESGSPGSAYYDTDLDEWVKGRYREFLLPQAPNAQHDRLVARTVIR